MKAFVITLQGNPYSEAVTTRCIESAHQYGVGVTRFVGIDRVIAETTMHEHGLTWTWADGNTKERICGKTGLRQFPYKTNDLRAKIGCSMSHFLLWKRCVELDEPILILEHDAVFLRPFQEIDFNGICQLNDPNGATRRGKWWGEQMKKRGPGVFEKTWVIDPTTDKTPDGLAGASAYLIKPWAAAEVIEKCYDVGLWPNDALVCKQLFPYLEEYYPFITKVAQTQSTTV